MAAEMAAGLEQGDLGLWRQGPGRGQPGDTRSHDRNAARHRQPQSAAGHSDPAGRAGFPGGVWRWRLMPGPSRSRAGGRRDRHLPRNKNLSCSAPEPTREGGRRRREAQGLQPARPADCTTGKRMQRRLTGPTASAQRRRDCGHVRCLPARRMRRSTGSACLASS